MKELSNPQIVRLSVFYHTNLWQKFIGECLKPYILQKKQDQQITAVFIAFNYYQGSNIRLALNFTDEEKEIRLNEIHALFCNYLKNNASVNLDLNFMGNSLFMDFPQNSCQYDLFNVPFSSPRVRLQLLVSEKILEVFSESTCDDSSVFTFLLHLIIAFSKDWESLHMLDYGSGITQMLLDKCEAQSGGDLDLIFQPYHELFMNSSDMIMDIYDDVVSDSTNVNTWGDIRAGYLQYLQTNPSVSEINTTLIPADLIIANQLGLNDQSLLSIYYIIHLIRKHSNTVT
jgi:hypothetical protein